MLHLPLFFSQMGGYSRIEDAENQLHIINRPQLYEPYRDEEIPSAPSSYQANGGKRPIFYQAIPYAESWDFPTNMILFVLGLWVYLCQVRHILTFFHSVFPGFWCISWGWGSQNGPYERWWRKLNVVMAWISTITILLAFLMLVVIANVKIEIHGKKGPDW